MSRPKVRTGSTVDAMSQPSRMELEKLTELRDNWRDAYAFVERQGWSDAAIFAEQDAYDALVDYVEAHDLNHSEWDPR
jgi:hypothetical protein